MGKLGGIILASVLLVGCGADGPPTIEDVCDHDCDCGAPPIAHGACVSDCVAEESMAPPTQACLDCRVTLSCSELLLGTDRCDGVCAPAAP